MNKPADITTLNSREDFASLMYAILDPLKPFYTKEFSGLDLGRCMAHYDIGATRMEAFSRPLWALVPFWAGNCQGAGDAAGNCRGAEAENCMGPAAESTGTEKCASELGFERICRLGLAAGTNPESSGYWGECGDFDQRYVEMAAIAYGIMYANKTVWEPLTDQEKDNLVTYLNKINKHPLPVCNWLFFAVLVNLALKSVGREYSPELLERYLNDLETFYIADGWYRDGDSFQKDYYISWAIHFYSLIYADRMKDEDPERAKLYRERAITFGRQFVYWFDKDGDAIPFGRSLTYRFAQVSFFSICAATGVEVFPLPVMKGLISRHLLSWMQKPIFDRDGVLTVGYGYPNLMMSERYNAPGSPYWAMKTFAILMLPEDHEFWKVPAASYPELPSDTCAMPAADMLVRHYGSHTTAYAPGVYSRWGHGQIVAKYSKFAYDTKASISASKSEYELWENAPDSMLAFEISGYTYVRRQCIESEIRPGEVYSKWSPFPGIEVETAITPTEYGHIRRHVIKSDIECDAYDLGFSVNRGDFTPNGYEAHQEPHAAVCRNDDWTSQISSDMGEGYILYTDPNLNFLYTRAAVPGVKYKINKGVQELTCEVRFSET